MVISWFSMSEVQQILSTSPEGDPRTVSRILPLLYDELRQLAARKLGQEQPGQTLSATALVHEAYLRLLGDGQGLRWDGPGHFFGAAAEAMRRILVERARRKGRVKHGGGRDRVEGEIEVAVEGPSIDVLALDELLERLAAESPAEASLVKLRFFAGLTMPEAARALGISLATAERQWAYARTWLYAELKER